MQQIYRRAPMPKCGEIALWHGWCPVNLIHSYRTPVCRSTSGWLLLLVTIRIIWNKSFKLWSENHWKIHTYKLLPENHFKQYLQTFIRETIENICYKLLPEKLLRTILKTFVSELFQTIYTLLWEKSFQANLRNHYER